MIKKSLLLQFFVLTMMSCNSVEADVKPNEKIFGRWYYQDYRLSFIDIEGNNYKEYMGEIGSEIKGIIQWQDSLNFELHLTEVQGVIGKSTDMRAGRTLQVQIIDISPTQLRWRSNNQTTTFIKDKDR